MRRFAFSFVILLGIGSGAEARQSVAPPKLEIGGSVGVIEARPQEIDVPYYQDWYANGRYAGSIGYYWTKNLKTEFEHAWSGEGSRYLLEYARINGLPYSYQTEQFFQLQQSTLRVVWQFRDNAWVHPYLSAGAVMDIEHQRLHVPLTSQQSTRGERILVHNELSSGDRYEVRGGASVGGGAKFYVSERAFFNTGAIVTFSQNKTGTVNLIAGFGIDF